MIPNAGSNPDINIVVLGASLLKKLFESSLSIQELLVVIPKEIGVSSDHIILTLDWLFLIDAISMSGDEVYINEVS